ncbi:MAG: cell division protein FtsQ/DivIB [Gammaproteobacteria bacterium]|nr:cell division protein FtsQ/DivIB [Gammaproteobacteria bacterium]
MRAEALLDLKDIKKREKNCKRRHLQAVTLDLQPTLFGEPKRVSRRFIVIALLILVFVVTSALSLRQFASSFSIEHVLIEGEFHNEQAREIEQALKQYLVGDLFTVNLSAAHRAVTDLAWVANARLQRGWPNKIVVNIDEQVPVARWNAGRLVNAEGLIFEKAYGVDLSELPVFVGPDDKAIVVMNRYRQLQPLLAQNNMRIIELKVDERNSWVLTTHDNVIMRLGSHDYESRLKQFLAVMKSDRKTDWNKIASVDLRHSNGFAVRWHSEQNNRQG